MIEHSGSALQLTVMTLAAAGYETRTFRDGKSARAALTSEAFDLIISDIYMPEADTLEVIQEEYRIRPDVPMIAVSGMREAKMLGVAEHLSACQTLPKPLSHEFPWLLSRSAVQTPGPTTRKQSQNSNP